MSTVTSQSRTATAASLAPGLGDVNGQPRSTPALYPIMATCETYDPLC